MPPSVPLLAAALLAAAVALAVEAWRTRLRGMSEWKGPVFASLIAIGAISGLTLLLALSGKEILMAAVLVPLTTICILRLWLVLERVRSLAFRAVLLAALLGIGTAAALSVTPTPLTRDFLRGSGPAESGTPDAGRSVRG